MTSGGARTTGAFAPWDMMINLQIDFWDPTYTAMPGFFPNLPDPEHLMALLPNNYGVASSGNRMDGKRRDMRQVLHQPRLTHNVANQRHFHPLWVRQRPMNGFAVQGLPSRNGATLGPAAGDSLHAQARQLAQHRRMRIERPDTPMPSDPYPEPCGSGP
jgi:hypothetical protein